MNIQGKKIGRTVMAKIKKNKCRFSLSNAIHDQYRQNEPNYFRDVSKTNDVLKELQMNT